MKKIILSAIMLLFISAGAFAQSFISANDLLNYLPFEMKGFTKNVTVDNQYKMDGTVDGTFAFIAFVTPDLEKSINIILEDRLNSDYLNTIKSSYADMSAFESDGSYSKTISFPDGTYGWVQINPSSLEKRSSGSIDVIINNRFHLMIQITGAADRELLDSIYESIEVANLIAAK